MLDTYKTPQPRGPIWSETAFASELEALAYGCFAMHAQNARADLNYAGLAADLDVDEAQLAEAFKALDQKEVLSVFQGVNDAQCAQVLEYSVSEQAAKISDTDRLAAVCLYFAKMGGGANV
jgi:Mg/Co/Ni transporter MgtE